MANRSFTLDNLYVALPPAQKHFLLARGEIHISPLKSSTIKIQGKNLQTFDRPNDLPGGHLRHLVKAVHGPVAQQAQPAASSLSEWRGQTKTGLFIIIYR